MPLPVLFLPALTGLLPVITTAFAGFFFWQKTKAQKINAVLKESLNTPNHGLIFFDEKGNLIFANPQAYSYLSIFDDTQKPPRTLQIFLDYMYDHAIDEDDQSLAMMLASTVQKNDGMGFRELIRGTEGRICLVEVQKTQKHGTVLALIDVTAKRATEQKIINLKQFNNDLYHAIEAATNGIMILRTRGRAHSLVFVNDAVCKIFDMNKNYMIGSNAIDVFGALGDGAMQEKAQDILQSGKGGDVEMSFLDAQGQQQWYAFKLTPVLGASKIPDLFIGVLTDLTELKQRESVSFQSQKLEALGQLAAGVAHDFNNMLSIIDGYSRMAAGGLPADAPARDHLERILAASQRGANLIKQMLTFSRHKIVVETVIDLGAVVHEQETLLLPLVGASIKLTTMAPDENIYVECQTDNIVHILMNLIVNARDSMPKGGSIMIDVHVCTADELPAHVRDMQSPHGFACLSVSDSGTGMKKEVIERMFDPFFTTKDQGKGTGLGLSMVYGLVRQIGGAIDVRSVYGFGTTMAVYLPLTDKRPNRVINGSLQDIESLRFDGFTALISEDEPDLLMLVSDMLQKMGMNVLQASNGSEALVVQDEYEGQIDLLLTDVVMPEMNGVELSELVQSLRPEIKVVFMSGYPEGGQSRITLPEGAFFMAKPLQYEALARLLYKLLNEKKNGDASQPELKTARWISNAQDIREGL